MCIRDSRSWAKTFFLESAAGMAEAPDNVRPKDSTMTAMVDAVPMVMQWPTLLLMQLSAYSQSSCVIFPVFISSSNFHTWVPEPMAVSYTHLDVYKRQPQRETLSILSLFL